MSKGVMKIAEALMASLLIISTVMFFVKPIEKENNWGYAQIKLQAQDLLYSLVEKGDIQNCLKSDDAESCLRTLLSQYFSGPLDFSFYVDGIPSNVTYISCLCDENELSRLKKILQPDDFSYKSRPLHFRFSRINSIDEIDERTNVLFVFDYTRYEDFTKENLENLLTQGKNIFVISDLSKDEVESEIFRELFNLSYKDASSTSAVFYNTADPKKVSYKIAKYFVNSYFFVNASDYVPTGGTGHFYIRGTEKSVEIGSDVDGNYVDYEGNKYRVGDTFVVDSYNIKVYDIYYSEDGSYVFAWTYLGIVDKDYEFKFSFANVGSDDKSIIYNPAKGLSGAKVNYGLGKYGSGRVIWLDDYDEDYDDMNQLVRALVLWAGGEKYDVIKTPSSVKRFFSVKNLVFDNGEFYQVAVNMWHIFFY